MNITELKDWVLKQRIQNNEKAFQCDAAHKAQMEAMDMQYRWKMLEIFRRATCRVTTSDGYIGKVVGYSKYDGRAQVQRNDGRIAEYSVDDLEITENVALMILSDVQRIFS